MASNAVSDNNMENVWNVLDRIIQSSLQFAHLFPKNDICNNENTLTVTLANYELCGFNSTISKQLYSRTNLARRRRCESEFGLLWERGKKLTIRKDRPPPMLYYHFVLQPVAHIMSEVASGDQGEGDDSESECGMDVDDEQHLDQQQAPQQHPPQPQDGQAQQLEQHQEPEVMVNVAGRKHVQVVYPNHKIVDWFKITRAAKPVAKFTHFNRILPKKELKKMLSCVGGSLDQGVYMLTKQLHAIDSHAVVQSLQDSGAMVIRRQTAEETLAMMDDAGISRKACRTIGRHLRCLNNQHAIIATPKQMDSVCKKYAMQPTFGTYRWREPAGPHTHRKIHKRAKFWWVNLFDNFVATLKK